MLYHGFSYYRLPLRSLFASFPFGLLSLPFARRSPSRHISYWHHPHTSTDHLPILFIHGIGIGLHTYLNFFKQHLRTMPEIGLIAIEIPAISSRITSSSMLLGAKMADEILRILEHHGWERCVVACHSYGFVVATHLLRDEHVSPRIDNMLFVDPVAFSFHDPNVAYNFLRRAPRTASEIQLQYFVEL